MRGNKHNAKTFLRLFISIHASTWEATRPESTSSRKRVFQFTPLHERQRIWAVQIDCLRYFNSRLYMRGNSIRHLRRHWRLISIHASTWEATWSLARMKNMSLISIHASTWEATDNIQPPSFLTANFNSRLYMRGNMQLPRMQEDHFLFQFTPLHERQRDTNLAKSGCGPFQFTPLHERQQARA